ncbi:hypothetical protein [Blautia marasmi]|uniref:hypothetical protein n=1 Tax=Blautia marasmi TaxID=1917868 RepID=UPI001D05F50A|nr:hypothetical protein [Blautia marasmi]MCB6192625.1 hypothetical protein [Blautia marasmi]
MSDVAYQNKDIVSKILTDGMKEKSFAVYGVPMSRIKDVLPVNLPAIEANEMATDNLFRLEDDSYAVVDYESSFSEKSKIKYVCHIARILKKYESIMKLRMIVLCTSGTCRINTVLDVGCLRLSIEPGYLSSIETDRVFGNIRKQIEDGKKLNDTEVMQMFVLSGVITFADKIIEPDFARRVEEWIKMTKVGRLFEEEKLQAMADVRQSMEKTIAEKDMALAEKDMALAVAEKEKAIAIAEKQHEALKLASVRLLLKGSSPKEVSKTTGLPLKEIEEFLK